MSQISANIIVETSPINVQIEQSQVGITVEPINLNILTAGGTTGNPGGNTGELQYNTGSGFGGIPNVTFASGNLTLTNVANLKIAGGTNGYFLQTDGTGNLTFAAGGGGGNGSPGGSNTQIQYNDNGLFGGSTAFTFDQTSNVVTVNGNIISNNANLGNAVTANYFIGNLYGQANTAIVANTVSNAVQSNITSVGILSQLNVAGTTSIQQAIEKVTANSTGSTGTVVFDLLNQAILYKTANASTNFTINIRGNSTTALNTVLSNNESITCTYLNTNGATGYYANVIQIDGNTITPKWIVNGIPASGTANGLDAYTFNIIKTASHTYTVLGTKVGFA